MENENNVLVKKKRENVFETGTLIIIIACAIMIVLFVIDMIMCSKKMVMSDTRYADTVKIVEKDNTSNVYDVKSYKYVAKNIVEIVLKDGTTLTVDSRNCTFTK